MGGGSHLKEVLADPAQVEAMAAAAFKGVDTDGSGFLDQREVLGMMTAMAGDNKAPPPTMEEVQATIDKLDTDKDGKLSPKEFEVVMVAMLTAMADAMGA